jgi:hypothetical protein
VRWCDPLRSQELSKACNHHCLWESCIPNRPVQDHSARQAGSLSGRQVRQASCKLQAHSCSHQNGGRLADYPTRAPKCPWLDSMRNSCVSACTKLGLDATNDRRQPMDQHPTHATHAQAQRTRPPYIITPRMHRLAMRTANHASDNRPIGSPSGEHRHSHFHIKCTQQNRLLRCQSRELYALAQLAQSAGPYQLAGAASCWHSSTQVLAAL